jgi:hypothetical protein
MTDEPDPDIAIGALQLAITAVDDSTAKRRLIELASVGKHMAVRARARDVAEKALLAGEIDRMTSYSLDLLQTPTCEERRQVVARLRALGDKRAIPALKTAMNRKKRCTSSRPRPEQIHLVPERGRSNR